MKHDGKLENCPFGGPLYIKKNQLYNIYSRKITKIDHDKRNLIKTQIHPTTQILIRPQLISLDQKKHKSALKTRKTI